MIFELNGVDYSAYAAPDSITVERTPVYARKITTPDGVDHNIINRWKHSITVQLMPLTREQVAQLSEELSVNPVRVRYENPVIGTVTQNMQCDNISQMLAIRDSWREYWKGGKIVFTEN